MKPIPPRRTVAPVSLRIPHADDEAGFLAAVKRSEALLRPWVEPPESPREYAEYLERNASDAHLGMLVIDEESGGLAGVINLSHIIGGKLRSAFLGYYAFVDFAGRGRMRAGLELVLREAFDTLKLHRLEANIQPGNLPSLAFIQRCGFSREGFSPRYLKVQGRWRDHERWALLVEHWRQRVRSPGSAP